MAQLQLSTRLISDVCNVIEQADPAAADPGIASQYLTGIVGFLLGQQDMPTERKQEIADELNAFCMHVVQDVERQRVQQAPAPAAPTGADAFGVWKPGMS